MDNSELRRLFQALRKAGYVVGQNRKGHHTVRDRAGRRVATLPLTPSDYRSWRNCLAELRRSGFTWPPQRQQKGKS